VILKKRAPFKAPDNPAAGRDLEIQSSGRNCIMKLKTVAVFLIVIFAMTVFAQNQQKTNGGKSKMAEEFALTKVGQISVRAKDLDRATAFYRDQLGLKHLHKAPSLSVFDCGGITLLVSLPDNPALDHPGSVIYFDVDDIQKAHKSLSDRGVSFVEKPNKVGSLGKVDVWIAIFRDSEENLMGLRGMVAK
jgi:methylmalonyl-CoA/ethylmalonyl-CoA epimerase